MPNKDLMLFTRLRLAELCLRGVLLLAVENELLVASGKHKRRRNSPLLGFIILSVCFDFIGDKVLHEFI